MDESWKSVCKAGGLSFVAAGFVLFLFFFALFFSETTESKIRAHMFV